MALLTRSLAAGAVATIALGTTGAVAVPATAGSAHGTGHGQHGHQHGGPGLVLTRSAAATLDRYDVTVKAGDNARRAQHVGLRGTVAFAGEATTTWSRIRVNERTHRVTAVVNGGDRAAVLRFRGLCSGNDRHGRPGHGRTVLRLTAAGASSIDRAAGADAFDTGDAFAKASR